MDSACVYGVAWQNDRRKKCGNAMKGWGGRMLGAEGDKGARENERGNGIERRKKRILGKAVLDFFLQRVDYFESVPFVDNSFLDTLIGNRLSRNVRS